MFWNLRYAARRLRKSLGFTVTAVLTLALGIGATTAIFSAVYGLLLESLPFQDAGRIVAVSETHAQIAGGVEATYPDYEDWRAQQRSFTDLAAYSTINPYTVSMVVDGNARQLHRVLASGSFFSVLGITPLLGRTFSDRDEVPGEDHVAVLSALAWQKYFGRDAGAVGRTVDVNGAAFTIVGVLPAGASFPAEGEIWLPLSLLDSPTRNSRVWHSVRMVGRLREGVSLAEARTNLQAVAGRLATAYPATNANVSVMVTPLREQFVGALRPAMLCLMGAVVLVLLIACVNVASLLMVRAAADRREVSVRQALGADRRQLFAQYLAQSLIICALGGLLGSALAWGALPALREVLAHTGNAGMSMGAEMISGVRLSVPVLLVTMATCMATAIVFGMLPVMRISTDVAGSLRMGDRGATGAGRAGRNGRGGRDGRGILIAGEIGIAVMVLFLSMLVMRSYQKLVAVDPGFRTDHLLSAEIELPQPLYSDESPVTNRFYEQLLDKLNTSPGVVSAATTTQTPLKPSQVMTRFAVEGAPMPAPGAFPLAQIRYVSPAFFRTLGLKVREGRVFEQRDIDDNLSAFVVNETFAKRYLTARDPVGAKVLIGVLSPHPDVVPVIGVVADAHDLGVDREAQPELYIPGFGLHAVLVVRFVQSGFYAQTMESVVRQAVHGVNANQPVFHVESMDELLADSLARQRMTAMLLGIFASVALALAGIGIYGVLSYSVEQRTREIGVRMAVGANRIDILRLVLGQVGRFALLGAVAGLGAAFGGVRVMRTLLSGLLFETSVADPVSVAVTLGALAIIAGLAATLPAGRAASVNPSESLRSE